MSRPAGDLLQSDRTLRRPLVVELFCGCFGWSAGWIAEGGRAIGFDLEHLPHHGPIPENCELVIQDVLTLHGSQFRNADIILASPPCTQYSYLAMPWSRSKDPNNSKAAKALRHKWETEGPDNRLFDACFRIQREAIAATGVECPDCGGTGVYEERLADCDKRDWPCEECKGTGAVHTRYIPLIVENVRGAQPWVGRSVWNYGSFHLWGDVPALMPFNLKRGQKVPGFRFDGSGGSFQTASVEATGQKQNPDGTNHPTGSWFRIADSSQGDRGQKIPVYSDPRRNGGKGVHLTSPAENEAGTKIGGDWFSDPQSTCRKHGSRSNARKAASAQIAKIPFELARHIAAVYYPRTLAQGGRLADAAGKS